MAHDSTTLNRHHHKFSVTQYGETVYWYTLNGNSYWSKDETTRLESLSLGKLMDVMVEFDLRNVSVDGIEINKFY